MTRLLVLTGRLAAALLLCFSTYSVAQAQSVADNIRPVGQVCLANQGCEGSSAGTAAMSASTAASSPAPATAMPAAAPVPAEPEPAVAAAPAASDFDAAAKYQASCMACHTTGAAGAPKLGDAAAWDEKMAKGWEGVMANVLNGINAMPARGLCMDCSDDNLRAIVEYMISQ